MPTPSPEKLRAALNAIIDPELGYSIVALGLIYNVRCSPTGAVEVLMTLTTPTCPLQEHFRTAITDCLRAQAGVTSVQTVFTFTPRWSIRQATPAVQEELALLGMPLPDWS